MVLSVAHVGFVSCHVDLRDVACHSSMWTMGHSPEEGQETLHVPQVSSPVHCFQDLHPHVVHVYGVTHLGCLSSGC